MSTPDDPPKHEPKTKLVKARVTKTLKEAVNAAAAAKGDGSEAEAVVLREALVEYLQRRGYLPPCVPPSAAGAAGGSGDSARALEEPPTASGGGIISMLGSELLGGGGAAAAATAA